MISKLLSENRNINWLLRGSYGAVDDKNCVRYINTKHQVKILQANQQVKNDRSNKEFQLVLHIYYQLQETKGTGKNQQLWLHKHLVAYSCYSNFGFQEEEKLNQ